MDSSSPSGSYGHEATPVDIRDEDEGIGKSPDSQQVEVLIGFDSIRIVEPDARFIAAEAERFLAAAENNSLEPLVVALKGRGGGLVFNPDALTRAELLSLKGRGPLLLEGEPGSSGGNNSGSAGLPLLLDSAIAGSLGKFFL